MKIKIYAIGKIKTSYLKEGIDDYLTRLKPYVNIEIIELKDEPLPLKPHDKEIEIAKNKEGERVLKLLNNNEYLISLDLNKKQFKSEQFADYLNKKLIENASSISFVIGGSYGLSDALKKRSNDSLSLSDMTFLHQMTRLILLEQIYRSFKILNNETYHK